jgi:hypothetical protein
MPKIETRSRFRFLQRAYNQRRPPAAAVLATNSECRRATAEGLAVVIEEEASD